MNDTMQASRFTEAREQGALRTQLPDGRWHFQHGPIDLVIGAEGEEVAIARAVELAWQRFQSILTELAAELEWLRAPVQEAVAVRGGMARCMVAACWPHRRAFITPMAAVAGTVADELIQFFSSNPAIRKAYVNNGGDIALHLTHQESWRIGLCADIGRVKARRSYELDGDFEVHAGMLVRGIATSGWQGRSFSLGIADSVTVLASTAAAADAAATMIANAVNLDDPSIVRRPACELKDDTDLGERLVTVGVGTLSSAAVEQALDAGERHARDLQQRNLIWGTVLCLQERHRVIGAMRPAIKQAA